MRTEKDDGTFIVQSPPKKSYNDQINSPIWQKKRLKIFERDNFKCRICGEDSSQLHVHHLYYVSGREIHDYDNECLVTLCKDCHNYVHQELPKMTSLIAFAVMLRGMNYFDLCQLLNLEL